jgi:hypothetical protein
VNQQSSDTVISGAQDAFRLAVLLRRVGTRESQLNAERGQKKAHGIGIILTAIICLKGEDGKAKLSLNIGDEGTYCRKNVRLISQGDCPKIVCIIIEKDNIIFVPGMIVNRRGPNI